MTPRDCPDAFNFAIRRRDLARVDALRLDMGSDFWPSAAWLVLQSAMLVEVSAIPADLVEAARSGAKGRGARRSFSRVIRVRHYGPTPDVLLYLRRLARRVGLATEREAAIALVAFWASSAEAWPGAPRLISEMGAAA